MGFALAQAASELGAEVTVISGPVALATPQAVSRVDVVSAQDMLAAVTDATECCDIFISAAAVADYRVKSIAEQKIKKSQSEFSLELVRNPDIVSGVTANSNVKFVVGFAAETQDLINNAKDKLQRKNLDMVIANDVAQSDRGFDVDTNQVNVVWNEGEEALPLMSKQALAQRLMELIAERYYAKSTS